MEEALVAMLLGPQSNLPALVGARISWGVRKQGEALPAVVLTKIDGMPAASDDGASELHESRMQVDCYGANYGDAKTVARAVMNRLSGVAETEGAIQFSGIYVESERDFPEQPAGGTIVYRTSVDLIIWHKPTEA